MTSRGGIWVAITTREVPNDRFQPTHCADKRGCRHRGNHRQAPQAEAPTGLPAGAKVGFYEKDNVRIRFAEIGSGFALLATPGGGLNSRISIWPTAVINIMGEFKNDFRVITMDQRNATNGDSTGPVPVDNPWDAFADDQLGVMDHLGIRQFFSSAIASGARSA